RNGVEPIEILYWGIGGGVKCNLNGFGCGENHCQFFREQIPLPILDRRSPRFHRIFAPKSARFWKENNPNPADSVTTNMYFYQAISMGKRFFMTD
ncbi:MAG: hypothetical protein ABIM40_06450, partial [Pseudomonadota bacterium]